MPILLLLSFFQLLNGLDSNFIPKVSGDHSPCKGCTALIESFKKVINFQ